MQRRATTIAWLLAMALSPATATAQEPPPQLGSGRGQVGAIQMQQTQGPTGTVTGRVICGDTQRPARFAQVVLRRVPANGTLGGDIAQAGSVTQTALDGSFEADGVAPGDYFVSASAAGYVSERQSVQAEINAGMSVADVLAKLPVVHVSANGISSVNVTMDRGGTVSGQVQWEDGSPATGVSITAVSTVPPVDLPPALQSVPFYGMSSVGTDDRGSFRLTGLPAGDYLLRATLRGPQPAALGLVANRSGFPSSQIVIYAPGVFRKADAKPVTVKIGEERSDVRMVLNLGSLRTVSGHVSLASGSGLTTGRVSLTDPNDRTINMSGQIATNGDFAVGYVPPGTYAMQVVAGFGIQGREGGRGGQNNGPPAVTYQPATQTIIIGNTDVTGVSVTLVPVQAAP
jgi:hypothetical protein